MDVQGIEVQYKIVLSHKEMLTVSKALGRMAGLDITLKGEDRFHAKELNTRFLVERARTLGNHVENARKALEMAQEAQNQESKDQPEDQP